MAVLLFFLLLVSGAANLLLFSWWQKTLNALNALENQMGRRIVVVRRRWYF